ncbi:MFS transporter [Opitutus terrae]|uniref:Major facilitator superfamily MFS_1 n=1 Tax=Opitutus terrae (strain DSM 11246 / JCM 15787 / PB90-1) TaxID=452637 RepID=B1ZUY3_OPITP|nr:MFS transporter [Opitutus terrae]ACB75953.1 major facilitator superfamily MFS_1 [Opitutus terrae PB90-1]
MFSPSGAAGSPAATPPTRARYWVVVFAITLAVIQYIDRVCISQAAPSVSSALDLSKEQMGWVFSAFTLAYALFEIPTGYWGDRNGPRRVLLRVVLWWSFFTAATGWVWNWSSLVVTRFLFGAGEAGCFPNLTKAFEAWLPTRERIRAQGIMWMSARWGGAVTPYLVFLVLSVMNWRLAFLVFGLLGVVWAILFARWFRDNPREHPSVNAAEAALLPERPASSHFAVPWRKLITAPSVWCVCGQYFACSYAWYFFITWFPTYLLEVHKFDLKSSALLAGLPLLLGGAGCFLAGALVPRFTRRFGHGGLIRRLFGVVGQGGAALCLIAATFFSQPLLAVTAIALASFSNDLSIPCSWTTCMDVGGRYVGTLSGMMNMVGNIGGFLSPIVLGYIVGRTGDWNLTFYVTAAVYLLGALCWWLIDPVTPLELSEESAA